jgi:teichuronic acid biosynthesis glycosyltransferase TuaG
MPAFNAEKYIRAAIQSVLQQTYYHWELLIINDGSIDNTENEVLAFDDARIIYRKQRNAGVSGARNAALKIMKGDYFCFLDADDIIPPNSLQSRLDVFRADPSVDFVDGRVEFLDEDGKQLPGFYQPSFRGKPFAELAKLNASCFFGPSWTIKRDKYEDYEFDQEMSHAEDLYFYLTISKDKKYDFTENVVLNYRETEASAMSDLLRLEKGYIDFLQRLKAIYPEEYSLIIKFKVVKVMFLSHLIDGRNLVRAVRSAVHLLRA